MKLPFSLKVAAFFGQISPTTVWDRAVVRRLKGLYAANHPGEHKEFWSMENIFPPPLTAEEALGELARYFLGENWVEPNPISSAQINTDIVGGIMQRYAGDPAYMAKLLAESERYEKEEQHNGIS